MHGQKRNKTRVEPLRRNIGSREYHEKGSLKVVHLAGLAHCSPSLLTATSEMNKSFARFLDHFMNVQFITLHPHICV